MVSEICKTLDVTIESARSYGGKNGQTVFSAREDDESEMTHYMIDGCVRLDIGERARLYFHPDENPLNIMAVAILAEDGKEGFTYWDSCYSHSVYACQSSKIEKGRR